MALSKNAILDAHPFVSGITTFVPSLDILVGDPLLDLLASNRSCATRAAKSTKIVDKLSRIKYVLKLLFDLTPK